jgi:hypothetical protein
MELFIGWNLGLLVSHLHRAVVPMQMQAYANLSEQLKIGFH